MAIAPLSGCIGNNDDVETPDFNDIFTLNQVRADLAVVVAGEYNEFILEGEGTMITVPEDIMLFVNNTIIPSGMAVVCLLYTSPSPRDRTRSRMPSSA